MDRANAHREPRDRGEDGERDPLLTKPIKPIKYTLRRIKHD